MSLKHNICNHVGKAYVMLLPKHGLCYVYSLACLSDYGVCFSNYYLIGCACKNKMLGLIGFTIIYAIYMYKLFNSLCFSLFHFEEHIQWLPVGLHSYKG